MLTRLYRLRHGAQLRNGQQAHLVSPSGGLALGPLDEKQLEYLRLLTERECGAAHPALLAKLVCRQWVRITLCDGARRLLTLRPVTPRHRPFHRPPGRLVLSRFTLLRRDNDSLLLESPRAGYAAELHDRDVVTLLGGFTTPAEPSELSPAHRELADQLADCGLLVPEHSEEETDLGLLQWRPHELWFHARSSGEHVDEPSGGTYWARGRFAAPPARNAGFGAVTPLSTPDLRMVTEQDPKLTEVLERRRSIRAHGADPMTTGQLAEFLYRTVRTRRTWRQGELELTDRPYPSGGALHELEIYPVITGVAGLAPGFYHYDGHGHRLELVSGTSPVVHALCRRAARAARMPGVPQVLLVVTARFGRLMWKYESMAYSLTLKHTGVLFASMYQVATAMGLAPCALGGGDSDLFAQVTGLDPVVESSVGEFLLGSAPVEEGVVGL